MSKKNEAAAVSQNTNGKSENDVKDVKEVNVTDDINGTNDTASKDAAAASGKGGAKKKGDVGYYIRIAGVLTLICSFVALMLALVNMLTKDRIKALELEDKKSAVAQIFGDIDDALLYDAYTESEVYIAVKDGGAVGYCVSVVSQGYGGEISMMVGLDTSKNVVGVRIISMSETPGVGSKTQNDSFLSQYAGKNGPFTVGDNVDGISGATISSKGVTAGVNLALEANVDLRAAAEALGLKTEVAYGTGSADADSITPDDITADADTSESEFDSESRPAQAVTNPMTQNEETHIDPSSVGMYQNAQYYESDTSYTYTKDTGYYMQKETTDTESDTSDSESDTIN